MSHSRILRTALAVLVCGLAAGGALVDEAGAESTLGATGSRPVAGTVDTSVTIKRFAAVGYQIVGSGVATSTLRDANGVVTSVASKPFGLRFVMSPARKAQTTPCQILHLELDEIDLTLLGLHVFLRAANHDAGEKIQLTLQAIADEGVLGKLFCDLVQSTKTAQKTKAATAKAVARADAAAAVKQLNKRATRGTILRAQETLYAPNTTQGGNMQGLAPRRAADECQVLHLILGPLHLDLLGLVVDLNKIALDLTAIPGTTLGNLFCSIAGGTPLPGTGG